MPERKKVYCGDAAASYGQPNYGKRRIVANAPLSANNFDAMIQALTELKKVYLAEAGA